MQIIIKHHASPTLELPINYHHILQAIIYNALSTDKDLAKEVHEQGFSKNGRAYKLFQFSQIRGKYQIANRKIMFSEEVSFEIRSVDQRAIMAMKKYFETNGITYGSNHYENVTVTVTDYTVEDEEIVIKMRTPVTVHATDKLTKKTFFFHPDEQRFATLIRDNFKRKYNAYTGILPEKGIEIETISFREKDKFVTNYKGFYISGWYGIYKLKGERKYLDFLYQTGLGDRNSQGFGMFDVVQ